MTPTCLRAAARKVDGLDEQRVVPIAIHLDNGERARALYLLTVALGDLTPWDRSRLDQLYQVVLQLLDQPDVTGLDARNLVERRRAEADPLAGDDPRVIDRIEHAPRAYLLSQEAADIARQAAFVEPVPARGEASVAVLPVSDPVGDESQRCSTAVAHRGGGARPPGLLATVSGVIADAGLDILDAAVATWGDGAALDTLLVKRSGSSPAPSSSSDVEGMAPPDPVKLEAAIVAAFDATLESRPNPDAELRFDDHASPWYTICEVRSPDRRGLLHSLTAAMASAGVSVHSARLVTIDGTAVDRFELTDRNERKLDDAAKAAVLTAVREGVTPKRRLLSRRRSLASRPVSGSARVGVDTGGTFTDLVTDDGEVRKAPSTPADPADAVRTACAPFAPDVLAHGTTVATNAMLQRKLGRVALVATRGFADVIEIARQARPSLYDARVDRPAPLVPRELRFEVSGRLDAAGRELEPFDGVVAALDAIGDVDAVAVCLLHADLDAAP